MKNPPRSPYTFANRAQLGKCFDPQAGVISTFPARGTLSNFSEVAHYRVNRPDIGWFRESCGVDPGADTVKNGYWYQPRQDPRAGVKGQIDVTIRPTRETFAGRLSAAMLERGATLSGLSAQLSRLGEGVSVATLSYWRSGGRHPSRSAVPAIQAIEEILAVPRGELVDLALRGPRKAHVPTPAERPYTVPSVDRACDELAAVLGETDDLLTPVVFVARLEVSADWTRGKSTRMSVARAHGGEDVAHVVEFIAIPGGTEDPPALLSSTGMRLLDMIPHPDGEVFGFRFELTGPVASGSLAQYSSTYDVPLTEPTHGEAFTRPVREAVLALEFDPETAPEWVEEVEGWNPDEEGKLVPLDGRNSIVIARSHFGPGLLALRWSA